MATIRGQISGDLEVREHGELTDLVEGNVTVAAGVRFKVYGMIKGNLVMEKKSEVSIHGFVAGKVLNFGGSLVVFGKVGGEVNSYAPEMSLRDKNILIKGGGVKPLRAA